MVKKKLKLLCILLYAVSQINVSAQVTIGSGKKPEKFSTLEIDSSTGGIRYPQMNTSTRDLLSVKDTKANGLILYNMTNKSLEYYAGDGEWIDISKGINQQNQGDLATVHLISSETLPNILKYTFKVEFPSVQNISDIRVGKHMDFNNLISDTHGDFDGPIINSTYPITVEISKERLDALIATTEYQRILTLYLNYNEKGISRRVNFNIELPIL